MGFRIRLSWVQTCTALDQFLNFPEFDTRSVPSNDGCYYCRRSGFLPKVTQLVYSRTGIETQICFFQSYLYFFFQGNMNVIPYECYFIKGGFMEYGKSTQLAI